MEFFVNSIILEKKIIIIYIQIKANIYKYLESHFFFLFSLSCTHYFCLFTASGFIFIYFPNFSLFFLTDTVFFKGNMLSRHISPVSLAGSLAVSFGEAGFSPGLRLFHYLAKMFFALSLFLSLSLRRNCF